MTVQVLSKVKFSFLIFKDLISVFLNGQELETLPLQEQSTNAFKWPGTGNPAFTRTKH